MRWFAYNCDFLEDRLKKMLKDLSKTVEDGNQLYHPDRLLGDLQGRSTRSSLFCCAHVELCLECAFNPYCARSLLVHDVQRDASYQYVLVSVLLLSNRAS